MKPIRLVSLAENKYNQLLSVLILVFLASPFVGESKIGNTVILLILLVALVAVIHRLEPSRRAFKLYICLALLALIVQLFSKQDFLDHQDFISVNSTHILASIRSFIFLFFLSVTVYAVTEKELLPAKQVTADTIKGGVCVYFLIGIAWADLYTITYSFNPSAFYTAASLQSRADLFYFSFTTLTTVGYGDILPVSPIARVLANLEGIIGTMYPAIFIARLVGLYSSKHDQRD
jgi:hypothetical protein